MENAIAQDESAPAPVKTNSAVEQDKFQESRSRLSTGVLIYAEPPRTIRDEGNAGSYARLVNVGYSGISLAVISGFKANHGADISAISHAGNGNATILV